MSDAIVLTPKKEKLPHLSWSLFPFVLVPKQPINNGDSLGLVDIYHLEKICQSTDLVIVCPYHSHIIPQFILINHYHYLQSIINIHKYPSSVGNSNNAKSKLHAEINAEAPLLSVFGYLKASWLCSASENAMVSVRKSGVLHDDSSQNVMFRTIYPLDRLSS